jgi:RNAse (barnase) inhibitor barstar
LLNSSFTPPVHPLNVLLKKKMTDPWPFDQPPNCATVTTSHVMKDGQLITHVYHDEDDHGWQFHYPGEKSMADSMLVALKEVIDLDVTLLELADLPPGWMASRASKADSWERARTDAAYPEIVVDWAEISSVDQFYDQVLPQCQSPSWHGRNLNALSDSWVTGGINPGGPPYRFRFVGSDTIGSGLKDFVGAVIEIARESVEENGGSCKQEAELGEGGKASPATS